MPGRLLIPLERAEVEPLGCRDDGGHELETRRAPGLLAEGAPQRVRHVGLATLEHGQPGDVLGNDLPHEALHRRRLAPVAVVGLEDHLDAGVHRSEAVRAGADGRLLESVVSDLLDVLLGHDPARAGRRRGVEGQKVRPRLLQPKAHAVGVDDVHAGDPVLQQLGRGAAVALERELHVLRGERVAVVEHHALSQHELVAEPIPGHRPRLGERRRHAVARHGLHHRVVDGVQHLHDRDDAGVLARIEPRRGDGDVDRPRHLRLGSRRQRRQREDHQHGEGGDRGQERAPSLHRDLLGATPSERPCHPARITGTRSRRAEAKRGAGAQRKRAIISFP